MQQLSLFYCDKMDQEKSVILLLDSWDRILGHWVCLHPDTNLPFLLLAIGFIMQSQCAQ